jgi:hypothetical protein
LLFGGQFPMALEFVVGQRYADMSHGAYVVKEVVGDEMRVALWDGKETILSVSEQAGSAMGFHRQVQEIVKSSMLASAGRVRALQKEIGGYRAELAGAMRAQNRESVGRLRSALVEKRLEFFKLLRRRTPAELDSMRLRLVSDVKHETGLSLPYHNVCWACKADVDSATNDRCPECTWYICYVDVACKSPRFGACRAQAERMGQSIYESLGGPSTALSK